MPTVGMMFAGRLSGCPSINTYFPRRDISFRSGGVSVKLATNIQRGSKNCSRDERLFHRGSTG